MIAKDKEWSLNESSNLAKKLTDELNKYICSFKGEDDASEIIYVVGHATALFFSTICLYFDNIGDAYKTDTSKLKDWLFATVKGLIESNQASAGNK